MKRIQVDKQDFHVVDNITSFCMLILSLMMLVLVLFDPIYYKVATITMILLALFKLMRWIKSQDKYTIWLQDVHRDSEGRLYRPQAYGAFQIHIKGHYFCAHIDPKGNLVTQSYRDEISYIQSMDLPSTLFSDIIVKDGQVFTNLDPVEQITGSMLYKGVSVAVLPGKISYGHSKKPHYFYHYTEDLWINDSSFATQEAKDEAIFAESLI